MKEQTLTYLLEILQDFQKFNRKIDESFGQDVTSPNLDQTECLMYWYMMGLSKVYDTIMWIANIDPEDDVEFFDIVISPTTNEEKAKMLLELGNRNK